MADSSNTQRTLCSCSKGPSGSTIPPTSDTSQPGHPSSSDTSHPGQGEQASSHAAALNRLLSPLAVGTPTAAAQRRRTSDHAALSQPPPPPAQPEPRRTLRPISSWRPDARIMGHSSTSDAAHAEPNDEVLSRGALNLLGSANRSDTRSSEGDIDPLTRSAFFLDGSPSESGHPEPAPFVSRLPVPTSRPPATVPRPASVPNLHGEWHADIPVTDCLPRSCPCQLLDPTVPPLITPGRVPCWLPVQVSFLIPRT